MAATVPLPEFSPDPAFEPNYKLEGIEVRGRHFADTIL